MGTKYVTFQEYRPSDKVVAFFRIKNLFTTNMLVESNVMLEQIFMVIDDKILAY